MFPKIMQWVSLAALLLAIAVRRLAPEYGLLPQFVIFLGASVIVLQSINVRKYGWTAAFGAIAVFFNPILILVPAQAGQFFLMVLVCIAVFAFALASLETPPLLSIPPVGQQLSKGESL